MKRRSAVPPAGPNGKVKAHADRSSKVLAPFPQLLDHCTVCFYDDGAPRKVGWFFVKTQGPLWVVVLKEPDACLEMTVTGPTCDDALALAEILLGTEDAPWVVDSFALERSKKPKK